MFCTMLGGGHSVKEKNCLFRSKQSAFTKEFFCEFVSWKFIEKSSFFTNRHFFYKLFYLGKLISTKVGNTDEISLKVGDAFILIAIVF